MTPNSRRSTAAPWPGYPRGAGGRWRRWGCRVPIPGAVRGGPHEQTEENRSGWPVPQAATAEDFAKWGKRLGLLRTDVTPGDILLQFNPGQKAFVRAGVVVRVLAYGWWTPNRPYVDVESIEGDAGPRGELAGGEALRVARRLSPRTGDRFLRWSEAGRGEGGDAAGEAA